MKILTGLVTFNPDIDRLQENLSAIVSQDTDILIFDNGSKNFNEIENLASSLNCKTLSVKKNRGIAYGLKVIMDYAMENDYEWVLSLDQDSVISKKLINKYKAYAGDIRIGAITCYIIDRNFEESADQIYRKGEDEIKQVKKCITSGCFMRVAAYAATDGYDVSMFIDYVDFDICYALLRAGYQIIKIPFKGLLHEDGHGTNVSFFGRKCIMYHKSSWRRFYMMRNEIYLSKKFPEIQSPFITTLRCLCNMFLVFVYEEDKVDKLRNGLKGAIQGIMMEVPKSAR